MNRFERTRHYERKLYRANMTFAHQDKLYYGTLKDISLGGAFIITPMMHNFFVGDTITISIPFASGDNHIKRGGHIKWLNDESFAVEF